MNSITKELAETLKELRTKFDAREHLGMTMVRVDAALDRYDDACKAPEPSMINCWLEGEPPNGCPTWNDWYEEFGSKGILHGLKISSKTKKMTDLELLALIKEYFKVGGLRDDGSSSEYYGTLRDFYTFARAIHKIGVEDGRRDASEGIFSDKDKQIYDQRVETLVASYILMD
jgi:hypothetical protein